LGWGGRGKKNYKFYNFRIPVAASPGGWNTRRAKEESPGFGSSETGEKKK